MKILIAEDDAISCRVLETTLRKWNYDVVVTRDGAAAWEVFQQPDAPALAVLDWMMPELDGVEVCRRVRTLPRTPTPYIILLTAKGRKEDVVEGLNAGADDYLTKPFDRAELQARLNVGERILKLQSELATRVTELQEALARVKQLQGMLPICCYCKKIRDDQNYWTQVESYISAHSGAQFSHGVCPDCYDSVLKPQLDDLKRRREQPAATP